MVRIQIPPEEKQPMAAQFIGTGTLWTNYRAAEGPITKEVRIQLRFEEHRTKLVIDQFSPLKTDPFDTPLGKNTTTVSLIGQAEGEFDQESGKINVPAKLFIDHSLDLPILKEDSTINILLTTESVSSPLGNLEGSPMDGAGQVTLVGAAQFEGGILKGHWGLMEIKGVISPHP